jgi:hypothetical protein
VFAASRSSQAFSSAARAKVAQAVLAAGPGRFGEERPTDARPAAAASRAHDDSHDLKARP